MWQLIYQQLSRISKMKTIIDKHTGKVLYIRFDEPTEENEIAIDKICNIENPDGTDIYFNFETEIFYLQ